MNSLNFEEDAFDLEEHRQKAQNIVAKKARIKDKERQISIGKALLAVAAIAIAVGLFYLLSVAFIL